MNKKVRQISLLGLLSLPLIAITIAVAAFAFGMTSSDSTEATTIGPGTMNFRVKSGAGDCAATAKPTKCTVPVGGSFSLAVAVNDFPSPGYVSVATLIDWTGTGLTYKPGTAANEVVFPDSAAGIEVRSDVTTTSVAHAGATGVTSFTTSTFKGNVVAINMNCTAGASTNVINLISSTADALGASIGLPPDGTTVVPTSDQITINCAVAPPTNTRTNTPIPPTPTNTPTPVANPRMQKCTVASAISPTCQREDNLFLTRQGTKIPPLRCIDGTATTTLVERIHIPIPVGGPQSKAPGLPQEFGGFSFQLKYNPKLVCIDLNPGPAWSAFPQICTVDDSISRPTLQGVARISCVTLGKVTVIDTTNPVNRILATITVRAQPEAFTQILPDQDNGQIAELNNEKCKLTDLQGFPIEAFSCEDAKVTIRFLEGDVEPDCQVNTLDTQAIAFRWGALKGSLLFNARFNLEPSGHGLPRDQDIDVNDLQFVFGRFGSTCANPWPPSQLPGVKTS